MASRLHRANEAQIRAIGEQDARLWGVPCPAGCTWWVLDGDPAQGYCGARIDDTGTVHLERAYVAPECRGAGLQRAMIRTRVRWGKSNGAEVAESYTWNGNIRSMRSLIREGFMPTSREWDGMSGWLVWKKAIS